MKTYELILNEERHVTLTAYIQDVGGEYAFTERPAVLVLPGGGYAMCSDREADPVALAFLKAGYQAFVLRYTVTSKGKWPLPLEDYEAAMALIEEKTEWHIARGKVAVIGFSAGGHLAACAATMAKHRPAAAILGYPAILQDILDLCQPGLPVPTEYIDRLTPPCFLFACRDDSTVPIAHSLAFEMALARSGIQFESHIYSYGDHGFSTADKFQQLQPMCHRAYGWVEDCLDWLKEVLGEFTTQGMTAPRYGNTVNGNLLPTLSVTCTLEHLWKQKGAAETAMAQINGVIAAVAKERGVPEEAMRFALRNYTLKGVMAISNFPEEAIAATDATLQQIPNQI